MRRFTHSQTVTPRGEYEISQQVVSNLAALF
jgi:hypothetical protein